MSNRLVVYGASGYAGGLVARRLRARGLSPVLAGRRAEAVAPLGDALDLPICAFALDDPAAVDAALVDAAALLNCAGPFGATVGPLVDACIRTRTTYLDLAGEVNEFETARERAERAERAGVMLMPGVGFGVVPSDCLAVHLKTRLPTATRLELAFQAVGQVSRGTAGTVLTGLHQPGVERRDGRYVAIRPGARRRRIDFGEGQVAAVTNPWRGDVCTAFHSTGIGDIETYVAPPRPLRLLLSSTPYSGWLLGSRLGQRLLRGAVARLPEGPTDEQLEAGWTRVWGRVSDPAGNSATAVLRGPDAYRFTAMTAAKCAGLALGGATEPGFRTPAQMYGAGLVTGLAGVTLRTPATAEERSTG